MLDGAVQTQAKAIEQVKRELAYTQKQRNISFEVKQI